MSETSSNNKRIAKNTLLLYFRMMIIMAVNLYMSREVLRQLGVVDYGIYEVVAGVVAMFGFMNATLSSGTQRFITYAMGQKDSDKVRVTFSTAFNIHFPVDYSVNIGGLRRLT